MGDIQVTQGCRIECRIVWSARRDNTGEVGRYSIDDAVDAPVSLARDIELSVDIVADAYVGTRLCWVQNRREIGKEFRVAVFVGIDQRTDLIDGRHAALTELGGVDGEQSPAREVTEQHLVLQPGERAAIDVCIGHGPSG